MLIKECKQKLPFVYIIHRTDMFNFSRLVSGKIPTAYIHGILAFPRFCPITHFTRLIPFFVILINYPRTSPVESENSGMAEIEFALPHRQWNGIQLLVIRWIGGSWLKKDRALNGERKNGCRDEMEILAGKFNVQN